MSEATGNGPSFVAERLVQMTRVLRQHGVAAGTAEIIDAGRVVQVLGLDDRQLLREGLAAALVRESGQRAVFDQVFDVYFPAGVGSRQDDVDLGEADDPQQVAAALRDHLARALATQDRRALELLAAQAVERLGVLTHQPGFSAAQTLEMLAPQTAIAAAAAQAAAADGAATGTGTGSGTGTGAGGGSGTLREEMIREQMRRGVAQFRQAVQTEARRRNAEVRGRERVANYLDTTLERRDFTGPGGRELAELRSVIDPLAKKLAHRLSTRQKQHSHGSIDLRRTLRSSLATGGIPVNPVLAHRSTHRPDLVMLCDISGSVAGFSGFTMALMEALSARFRKLRVFAFVSTTDEITDLVRAADRLPQDVVTTALRTRGVLGWGASSSYGQALDSFVHHHLSAVGTRSTVLVLGDARSNYGLARLPALQAITGRARHATWLNPEPMSSWGTGDSLALQYAEVLSMHECRNIEQLRTFVARTMPI